MTMKLVSYFGRINQIRRDRPLPHEVLMGYVPCIFSSDKYESRSDRYTYITTITILEVYSVKAPSILYLPGSCTRPETH